MRRTLRYTIVTAVAALIAGNGFAASHREAPITALDHKADITDVYAFVSYASDPVEQDTVTIIMNVDPLLLPGNGPNYFPFDPDLRYDIRIDNDHDAVEDIVFQFRFQTEVRKPGLFTGFAGAGSGIDAPYNSPPPVPPGSPVLPAAITALDGPGSEGLSLRQTYTVRMGEHRFDRRRNPPGRLLEPLDGRPLVAVPTNVGPRTMPDYAALADSGIHTLTDGIRVFAGTVDDPFYIDLGAAFDSFNLRAGETGIPGVLSDTEDRDDHRSFAPDNLAGFNVNSIAVQVPIRMLTADGRPHGADEAEATIGIWATTSRRRHRILSRKPDRGAFDFGPWVQIQRMGNPLINELLIGTGFKDEFSRGQPKHDEDFAGFALDPVLARVLNALYEDSVGPGVLPIPAPPRLDLLPLVQYLPPICAAECPPGPVADLLRLNTGIPPTPEDRQSRLGFLTLLDDDPGNDDPAGFPNGRRVADDVTDIAARVVAGVLAGPPFAGFPHNRIGDGVNGNDLPYRAGFPYLGAARSGRLEPFADAIPALQ